MKLRTIAERFPGVWGLAIHVLVGARMGGANVWGVALRIGPFTRGLCIEPSPRRHVAPPIRMHSVRLNGGPAHGRIMRVFADIDHLRIPVAVPDGLQPLLALALPDPHFPFTEAVYRKREGTSSVFDYVQPQ